MTYIKSYQESVKKFEEKAQYTFSQGGFHLVELPDGVVNRIKSFLLSSAIAFHQGEVEKLEGMKKPEWDEVKCKECNHSIGESRNNENTIFNSALSSLLTDHKAFLRWAEKQ